MTPYRCPSCDADLKHRDNGVIGSQVIGVEVRGVYDGVLFWSCPFCEHKWHRFPEDHYLRPRAEKFL